LDVLALVVVGEDDGILLLLEGEDFALQVAQREATGG
jgi:hypothetical protein